MNNKVNVGECIKTVSGELTQLNTALVECQKNIDNLTARIEQQIVDKVLAEKKQFESPPEIDIKEWLDMPLEKRKRFKPLNVDIVTWFELSPENRNFVKPPDIEFDAYDDLTLEERIEYNEAKYAAPIIETSMLEEIDYEPSLADNQAEKKRLLTAINVNTKFFEKLILLNDLIKKSTYLQDEEFKLQDFDLKSITSIDSAFVTQINVWIDVLEKYPDVTPRFFEAMQYISFYLYKDGCVNWLSEFKTPADQRAALFVYDKLDNPSEELALEIDANSSFKPVYDAISDIEKHGKSESLQYEIDLARVLKRDLYRLETGLDAKEREQRKIVFLARLHSVDDFMAEDRSNKVVRGFKVLVEAVAYAFQKVWALLPWTSEEPSESEAKPKKTKRQKRVETIDKFFQPVNASENKDKILNQSVATNKEESKPIIWELPKNQ